MLIATDLSVITMWKPGGNHWKLQPVAKQYRCTSVSIRTATWTFVDYRNFSLRSCITSNTKLSFRKFSSSWHIQYKCKFIIYSDSYYIKQLSVGRATNGMIFRDGSFWIFPPAKPDKSFSNYKKDDILVELKHILVTFPPPRRKASCFLSLVSRKAALKNQMCAISFFMQRRIISFTLCPCYSRKKNPTLSVSLFVADFIPCRSDHGFA